MLHDLRGKLSLSMHGGERPASASWEASSAIAVELLMHRQGSERRNTFEANERCLASHASRCRWPPSSANGHWMHACPAGFENVTAANRSAAAHALGIPVPAWRMGQYAYFNINPAGIKDYNGCVEDDPAHSQSCKAGDQCVCKCPGSSVLALEKHLSWKPRTPKRFGNKCWI